MAALTKTGCAEVSLHLPYTLLRHSTLFSLVINANDDLKCIEPWRFRDLARIRVIPQ